MKDLIQYIKESLVLEQKEYNEAGFSNYFEKSDEFIEALNSNSVFFKKLFHNDLTTAKEFIKRIYNEVNEPVTFRTTPLLFNLNQTYVKLKRQYKGDSLENIYKEYKQKGLIRYKIGDGNERGMTAGDDYELKFIEYSKSYILKLINPDVEVNIPEQQEKLLSNLFDKIKVDNITLKSYIVQHADIIDPVKIVFHTAHESTRRNKNGQMIRCNGKEIILNFENISQSGKIIADVIYKLPNGVEIYISLKDKKYQLSNLGMSSTSMNVYPVFSEDLESAANKNFKIFCDFLGIDYIRIYNNITQKLTDDKKEKIDKQYYDNIRQMFICALGSNYYMVNSNGHISYVPDVTNKNSLSIKDVEVQYPSTTRKRININIKFNDNSDVTGSIQLAIRSKSGESNQNFGFIACQCVWGNVKINIKD